VIVYILSLVVLALAPLLYHLVHERVMAHSMLENATFFAIVGLIILKILPESFMLVGFSSLLVALLGWLLPTGAEIFIRRYAQEVHTSLIVIACLGLCFHGVLDGAMMALGSHPIDGLHVHAVSYAILLHRIPEGVFLWWLVAPNYGVKAGSGVLLLLALATSLGFFVAPGFWESYHSHDLVAHLQAFIAGSLLHVASHKVHHEHAH
jgi:hypothetical protein